MAKTKTSPAAPTGAGATTKGGFTVKSLVTLPLWKWADGIEKAFKIVSPIRIGKALSDRRAKVDDSDDAGTKRGPNMEPAHVAQVVNLETGELCTLIFGAVLKGTLEDSYPSDSYVGKCFVSTQSKIEGKRYKGYSLAEIEDPSA